jgi:hypothetical protein
MNPGLIRLAYQLALCMALMLQAGSGLASTGLQAEIRFEAGHEGTAWVGQEIELYLDLWSDGFRFGDQLYVLPEVIGAYLLQADSSTVKVTENRAGVQWQGLRYTFFLYPQRAGRVEVPPFDVTFSVAAGFGSEPSFFEFRTPEVSIEARLPPGADAGALVVTTTSFEMASNWTPGLPDEGPAELKVGDAITLEVRRSAQDVPGMVFAPLPEFSIDGLGIYPDPARVNDSINRGSLKGARSDSITFICEREGSFEIPGMRFQWWDPSQEVLSEKVVPALELAVAANPAWSAGPAVSSRNEGKWPGWRSAVAVLAGGLVLIFSVRWLARHVSAWLKRRRAEREAGEPWAFRQVQKACASGGAPGAYNTITLWLSRLAQARSGLTLMQLAEESGDAALVIEATALQEHVASGSTGEWSGGKLAGLLVQPRKKFYRTVKLGNSLGPLNPAAVRGR